MQRQREPHKMLQRRTILAAAAALFFFACGAAACRRDRVRQRHRALSRRHGACAPTLRSRALDQGRPPGNSMRAASTRPSSASSSASSARIRAWSANNITTPPPTMFYMFSGPDFLYANAFYPNAKTYVLSGARAGRHRARPHHVARIAGAEPLSHCMPRSARFCPTASSSPTA